MHWFRLFSNFRISIREPHIIPLTPEIRPFVFSPVCLQDDSILLAMRYQSYLSCFHPLTSYPYSGTNKDSLACEISIKANATTLSSTAHNKYCVAMSLRTKRSGILASISLVSSPASHFSNPFGFYDLLKAIRYTLYTLITTDSPHQDGHPHRSQKYIQHPTQHHTTHLHTSHRKPPLHHHSFRTSTHSTGSDSLHQSPIRALLFSSPQVAAYRDTAAPQYVFSYGEGSVD